MEHCEFIVIDSNDTAAVGEHVGAFLERQRGWGQLEKETLHAQQVEIWTTQSGELVVVFETDSFGRDDELAKALSDVLNTSTAAYFFRSTADLEELEIFDDGECVGGFYQDAAGGERGIWRGAETVLVQAVSDEWDDSTFRSTLEGALEQAPFSVLRQSDEWRGLLIDADMVEVFWFQVPPVSTDFERIESTLGDTVGALLESVGFDRVRNDGYGRPHAVSYGRQLSTGNLRFIYAFDADCLGRFTQRVQYDYLDETGRELGSHIFLNERKVEEFHAGRSPAHLERACRFMMATLARATKRIVAEIPPAAEVFEELDSEPGWRRAAELYESLWLQRLVEQERDSGWVPAQPHFRGERIIIVETEAGERFSFRFDTSLAQDSEDVSVGEIWEPATGAARARKLRIGQQVVSFDNDGNMLAIVERGAGG